MLFMKEKELVPTHALMLESANKHMYAPHTDLYITTCEPYIASIQYIETFIYLHNNPLRELRFCQGSMHLHSPIRDTMVPCNFPTCSLKNLTHFCISQK